MDIPFNITDPVVVLLSWALTALVGRIVNLTDKPKLRSSLPLVAVLLAVGAQTAFAAFNDTLMVDGALQWSVLLRGLAAGAMAVLGHSQMRELLKLVTPTNEAPTSGASGGGANALIVLLLIGGMSLTQTGCAHRLIVHDATTYTNELAWLSARNEEDITVLQRAVDGALVAGDQEGCLVYAEQLLIAKHAVAWRYAMMLHLADLGKDPGGPALIPGADTLCPVTEAVAPVIEED